MLYRAALSALLLALSFSSGVNAQLCTTQLSGIDHTYCGSLNGFNIFWTPDLETTAFEFEVSDDGWAAFGFSPDLAGVAPMDDSNVIFGCDDFDLDDIISISEIEELLASPWDALLPPSGSRNLADVSAGFLANNLADGITTLNRSLGICAIGFTRPNVLDGVLDQDLLDGEENRVVFARGDADVFGVHAGDGRASALQDFLGGVGDITDVEVEPLQEIEELTCVSSIDEIQYDNCGVFGPLNVFWNDFDLDLMTVDFRYETVDDGWKAFGWSSLRVDGQAMLNSNVVYGCADFVDPTPAGADYFLEAKNGAGVTPQGNQDLAAYSVTQLNGICAVEFTRPLAPEGVDEDGLDELQALNDLDEAISRAVYAQGGDEFGAHDTANRGFMDLDFSVPLEAVIDPLEEIEEEVEEPEETDEDGEVIDDGAASSLNAKVAIGAASLALLKFL